MKIRLLLALCLPAMTCFAQEGNSYPTVKDGISYHIDQDNNTAKVIAPINFNGQKKEYEGAIVIPEKIRFMAETETAGADYIVTEIASDAFANNVTTSVSIPGTIDKIPSQCFMSCTNLQSVTIHYGVREIGEAAFWGLKNLKNVYFNSTVTSLTVGKGRCTIGKYAFADCTALTNLNLNFISSIGERAFGDCSGLTSIRIPSSVTSIGLCAFSGCWGLIGVYITDLTAWCKIKFYDDSSNPLSYAHHLYLNNEEITALEIPNSVTSIGDYVFRGCTGLTSVNIPNSVTSIGESAFVGCTGLTGTLTIPNSVTSIGNQAFSGCSGLTGTLTIPNSVRDIGDEAFADCHKLTGTVTIPTRVRYKLYAKILLLSIISTFICGFLGSRL